MSESESRKEVLIPTPIDKLTGLPLPIAPRLTSKRLPRNNANKGDPHHGYHPKAAPELKAPVVGPAVRNAQLQIVPRDLHNRGPYRYHHFFSGPPLPQSNGEAFTLCVVAAAGFVSRQVIDTRAMVAGKASVRDAKPEELDILTDPWVSSSSPYGYKYFYNNTSPLADFFISHVSVQPVAQRLETEVDQFLGINPESIAERATVASVILDAAIEEATTTVDPIYAQAWAERQLHPGAPSTAGDLLRELIGADHPSARTIGKLELGLNGQLDRVA